MTYFFTLILIAIIILAIIGLGWNTFAIAVLDGFDKALNVGIPILKNLTEEATQEAQAVVETLDLVGPTEKEKAINDCMISLHAENPREQHLLDCDIYMPLVPRFIEHKLIYNTTETDRKFDEYMTQRVLDIPTDAEVDEQVQTGQLNLTPILASIMFEDYIEEQQNASTVTPQEQEQIDTNLTNAILDGTKIK